jgi:L-fucose isomerase
MLIVPGEAAKLDAETRRKLNAQTDPTWPHLHAKLDAAFEEFLALFPCNHVIGVPGDRVRALTYACEISGIAPVVLGSRGEERIAPIWERVR